MPPSVLLSASSPVASPLGEWLSGAGIASRNHSLGSVPAADFAGVVAAIIDVGAHADAAAAQTRRWRAELGDDPVPVVWVIPAHDPALAARGLDAGADAVLAHPLEPALLVAQVRAAARCRATVSRVAARAAEARLLGEQMNRAFAQLDRELDAARRVQFAFLHRPLPALGGVRFAVGHRRRSGRDFHAAHAIGESRVGFLVGDVIGSGAAGGLLGLAVANSAAARRSPAPAEVLAGVNRELLALGLDDQPLVALIAGSVNVGTGELAVARAGMPAPVFVPAVGEPETWALPGPFLGTAETTYPTRTARLSPGDKLLLGTDGTRPGGEPGPGDDSALVSAATRHRDLSGQRFADAVAAELLAQVRHEDDFTLLCVEWVTATPCGL